MRDAHGRLPLLASMSEIAGQLAVLSGVGYLQKPRGGRGVLAGSVPGIPPARVVIVGGGAVGYNAALMAVGVGAHVQLLDTSIARLRELKEILPTTVELLASSPSRLAECVAQADLVVGAVLVPGASAPKVITAEMVASMRPGSVLCDVSIDQGGCCATSRPTTYAEPAYEHAGVIHYCVANLPGAVPISSILAITNATLPYVHALAERGWRDALRADPTLAAGLNVCGGEVVHPGVAAAFGLDHRPVADLLVGVAACSRDGRSARRVLNARDGRGAGDAHRRPRGRGRLHHGAQPAKHTPLTLLAFADEEDTIAAANATEYEFVGVPLTLSAPRTAARDAAARALRASAARPTSSPGWRRGRAARARARERGSRRAWAGSCS